MVEPTLGYVITWRYGDGSASGAVAGFTDRKRAERLLELLNAQDSMRQFKLEPVPFEVRHPVVEAAKALLSRREAMARTTPADLWVEDADLRAALESLEEWQPALGEGEEACLRPLADVVKAFLASLLDTGNSPAQIRAAFRECGFVSARGVAPTIRYDLLSEYADEHRLHFNELCRVVRDACGAKEQP